jgi:hypothetical protein
VESITPSTGWLSFIFGSLVAALMWVVRGYANDVKHIKATYMTRDEITTALTTAQDNTSAMLAAHQASTAESFVQLNKSVDSRHYENTANFRELRVRLDATNDTLLRIALATQAPTK